MNEYIVTVKRYYEYDIPVEAESEEEAIEEVRDYNVEDYDDSWITDSGFEFEVYG